MGFSEYNRFFFPLWKVLRKANINFEANFEDLEVSILKKFIYFWKHCIRVKYTVLISSSWIIDNVATFSSNLFFLAIFLKYFPLYISCKLYEYWKYAWNFYYLMKVAYFELSVIFFHFHLGYLTIKCIEQPIVVLHYSF